tara:strand:- start:5150 stop:5569 length:420 start_codon:yes stop_codon:yes gene_type:complete
MKMDILKHFCVWILLLMGQMSMGQDQDRTEFSLEESIGITPKKIKKRVAKSQKKIDIIFKNKSGKVLYGNPCLREFTRDMGFEYALQSSKMQNSSGLWNMRGNNLIVYLKLIFKKSPFWKWILNNQVKDCRRKMGDFVG